MSGGMIEIEALGKVLPGGRRILDGIDLSVAQGEVFGLIGRSGAGKSMLLRCVNMLERPSSGHVRVDGADLSALDEKALRARRRGIGMVFQHFNLLSGRTARGNVALPLELAGLGKAAIARRVEEVLELVGMTARGDCHPARLSGGERQRVGIARALAPGPGLLLCDEATSALDPEDRAAILALIKELHLGLGLTILLATPEVSVVKAICDRVGVLDQGRLVEQGRVFDVLTRPEDPVTRRLVKDVVDRDLPVDLLNRLRHTPITRGNTVLRIVFTGQAAARPIISSVSKRHAVSVNIIQADIDYIQRLPYGVMVVETEGPPIAIQAVIDEVRGHGLRVEVMGHILAPDRAVA